MAEQKEEQPRVYVYETAGPGAWDWLRACLNDKNNWLLFLLLLIVSSSQSLVAQVEITNEEWILLKKNNCFSELDLYIWTLEVEETNLYCTDQSDCRDHIRLSYYNYPENWRRRHGNLLSCGFFIHYTEGRVSNLRAFTKIAENIVLVPIKTYANRIPIEYARKKFWLYAPEFEIYHALSFVIPSPPASGHHLFYYPGGDIKNWEAQAQNESNRWILKEGMKLDFSFATRYNRMALAKTDTNWFYMKRVFWTQGIQEYIEDLSFVLYEQNDEYCDWQCRKILKVWEELEEETGRTYIQWQNKRYYKVNPYED